MIKNSIFDFVALICCIRRILLTQGAFYFEMNLNKLK